MTMTLQEYTSKYPGRPKPIPATYAGQWIAWDAGHREIVAHGRSMSQVRQSAVTAGHADPILQKVPRGPFVGGA